MLKDMVYHIAALTSDPQGKMNAMNRHEQHVMNVHNRHAEQSLQWHNGLQYRGDQRTGQLPHLLNFHDPPAILRILRKPTLPHFFQGGRL